MVELEVFRKFGAPSSDKPRLEVNEFESVAELCLRPFPVVRLNICGTRARESEEGTLPSGGWSCWYCSNSTSSALRAFRYSVGVCEFRSNIVGNEKPRRR